MRHSSDLQPAVVIYAGSSPVNGGVQSGLSFRTAPVVDPYRIAHEHPERWAAYIRRFFADDREVMQTFHVCERTARKWRAGEMGCRANHQTVALLTHGQDAFDILVAAE